MAKEFDEKINYFKDLNVAAKELKDMRTAEWRRLKKAYTDSSLHAELKQELMGGDYVPRDATCCTDKGKFDRAFLKFRMACEQCDNVGKSQEDGE